ncbi:penicillin-binding protein [Candidatus Shapirobacteria bacterium CG08_land_8_20_14_0_20_39_18]|uniref:Penicillin-binding protein n=1 Tax=Candidatus Shapirobacteria bacterium CG08_land_8_20_14_0_20_39_18 TaxID=1974883 RepID=A0A2M6XDG8_9BACT|nr:MAG: penicillin-binding protein [Candidatus Shapirobacteria bacterium CG08_land_8_20_14_0_20_39_18]PIY64779.1 MAG: penicillin-binding protein [Candidatus Shapirobacteria bacterium CG_4_10_14_0_8_um_filter_39_15]PJE67906.1 MAG: penicillin-binding protein [Candidatus Shapirobacteria bacterium CG10_big_fil_rev_8_21_14_0_10_38_8]
MGTRWTGVIYSCSKRPKIIKLMVRFLQSLGKPISWLIFHSVYFLLFLSSHLYIRLPQRPHIPQLPHLSLPKFSLSRKLLFLFSLLASCFLLLFVFYNQIIKDLPNPEKLITRNQILTTKIFDRNNNLLYKIYLNQNRTLVKLQDIPKELILATLAIEDAEFYQHNGLSFRGIFRAAQADLTQGKIEGGSTITQQLVKNTLLTPEKTLKRKIKEVILSLAVEKRFSKDQILQMYLNEVGFGGAAYGVEEASQLYFGKPVGQLDLAQSAFLAGLPASPTTYSPFGSNPQKATERQQLVLKRMLEEKYITNADFQSASKEEIVFKPQKIDIHAPHFVMYIKDLLVQKYGETMVEQGGLEVTTSLDLNLQEMAQKIVTNEIDSLKRLHITNGAALVTNPQTGEILAMIGSKDYFDLGNSGNYNVTTALRQPGSSIKPVNYAVALQNGFTPATILSDTPITYHIPGQEPYSPINYDHRFHGNVPLRTALGSSYNVPAVKVLSAMGVNQMIDQGEKMGITTWADRSRFGLSLTLGGGEVKMTDMAVVYGTLANSGIRVDLQPILEIKDSKGKIIFKSECGTRGEMSLNEQTLAPTDRRGVSGRTLALVRDVNATSDLSVPCQPIQVLNPQVAYILTDILSDNSARTPAFGPSSYLNIANHPHVAVKTGTTQNLRDNWTVGYTQNYVAVVWVGNNDNTPMSYVASGITGASPIWNKIMTNLLKDIPDKEFAKPENLLKIEICPITNTLPCEGCGGKWEYFLPGTEPKNHCTPKQLTPTSIPDNQKTSKPGQLLPAIHN